ncbi:Splicing factor U2AF 65 kDa subunit [Bienertia sinuspersici]
MEEKGSWKLIKGILIFVGGIAEELSPEMLMEIVSAFGTLKAYRFEFNEDLKEPCAFLEYADQSVTPKACAGLNCMKLGGRILTVTQAVPYRELLESSESHPFYGIPEHVKPLLEKPTQVLKLKNVLDERALDLLSETDLEEIVEDVRLECSRFGSVVSINVVRGGKTHASISEAKGDVYDIKPMQPPEEDNHHMNVSLIDIAVDHDDGDGRNGESLCTIKDFDAMDVADDKLELVPASSKIDIEAGAAGTSTVADPNEADNTLPQNCDDKADNHPQEAAGISVSTTDDTGIENDSEGNHQEASIQESGVSSEFNYNGSLGVEKSGKGEGLCAEDVSGMRNDDEICQEVAPLLSNSGATEKVPNIENSCDMVNMFEVGCVLVEFKRTEASCMAAHCLHGRAFDDRIVTVEYVPLKAYQERFPK